MWFRRLRWCLLLCWTRRRVDALGEGETFHYVDTLWETLTTSPEEFTLVLRSPSEEKVSETLVALPVQQITPADQPVDDADEIPEQVTKLDKRFNAGSSRTDILDFEEERSQNGCRGVQRHRDIIFQITVILHKNREKVLTSCLRQ